MVRKMILTVGKQLPCGALYTLISRPCFVSFDHRSAIRSRSILSVKSRSHARVKSSLRRSWFITERITVFTNLSFEKLRSAVADVMGTVSRNLKHRLVSGNKFLFRDFRKTRADWISLWFSLKWQRKVVSSVSSTSSIGLTDAGNILTSHINEHSCAVSTGLM